jgi:CubicO group peptidase (beta-lactamase class C family)
MAPTGGTTRAFVLLMSCATAGHAAAEGTDRETQARLASSVRAFVTRRPQTVGLSVGLIVGDAACVYHHGTVERGARRRPTSRTLYPIASITKTFMGALLAQAAREGRLRLDDDLRTHLAGAFPRLERDGQPVRLFHLLNHRSGLPTEMIADATAVGACDRLRDGLAGVELAAAPGTAFRYSNAAAQLAACVLEGIYGSGFEPLLRAKVTGPLGMSDTVLVRPPGADVARGYDEHGVPVVHRPEALGAAGGLRSSLRDMLSYVRWQMDETDEVVRLSHRPTARDGSYAAGLNWQMIDADGRRLIWQDGALPGFSALCLVQPELRLGLVVLTNESDPGSGRALGELANEIVTAAAPRALRLP